MKIILILVGPMDEKLKMFNMFFYKHRDYSDYKFNDPCLEFKNCSLLKVDSLNFRFLCQKNMMLSNYAIISDS